MKLTLRKIQKEYKFTKTLQRIPSAWLAVTYSERIHSNKNSDFKFLLYALFQQIFKDWKGDGMSI